MESDRMGWLLDALDTAKYNAQRDIVKNERRQGMDNQPYGRASEILAHATYPASNPYSWDVIGSMTDLSAASEEDVKNFFRHYYSPNNAFLAIAGDFEPAQAKEWVKKYFGGLPAGPEITRPKVSPVTLQEEKRLVFEDRVQVPRLYIQWPTVGVKNDDQYALDMLSEVLTGSRTARLTKALVYDQQMAAQMFSQQSSNEDVGEFLLVAIPRPGHSLTDIENAIDGILAKVRADGPTADELKKAKAGGELSFLTGIQSNLGKANILASSAGLHGNAGYFKTDYDKSQAVTPEDVKRVAGKYLTNGRVVLSIVPIGKTDMASKPEQSKKVTDEPGGAGAEAPAYERRAAQAREVQR
jgi:zinc protease